MILALLVLGCASAPVPCDVPPMPRGGPAVADELHAARGLEQAVIEWPGRCWPAPAPAEGRWRCEVSTDATGQWAARILLHSQGIDALRAPDPPACTWWQKVTRSCP